MKNIPLSMKKNKNKKDLFFEDAVLQEALTDIMDYYGIDKVKDQQFPIMETWLKIWRMDFNFRQFIKNRINIFIRNRKKRFILVHKSRKVNATLHLKFNKDIKKSHKKIRTKL